MIVTMEISDAGRQTLRDLTDSGEQADEIIAAGLERAGALLADGIAEGLILGRYGLTMRHPGQGGLAGGVQHWWVDRGRMMLAVGVPSNHPAAPYAAIHEHGGTIRPRNARALAVPLSAEARQYSSPRDMADLQYIPRRGRPPLLARVLHKRGQEAGLEVHWVLLRSVTLPARRWLSRGVEDNLAEAAAGFEDVLAERYGSSN